MNDGAQPARRRRNTTPRSPARRRPFPGDDEDDGNSASEQESAAAAASECDCAAEVQKAEYDAHGRGADKGERRPSHGLLWIFLSIYLTLYLCIQRIAALLMWAPPPRSLPTLLHGLLRLPYFVFITVGALWLRVEVLEYGHLPWQHPRAVGETAHNESVERVRVQVLRWGTLKKEGRRPMYARRERRSLLCGVRPASRASDGEAQTSAIDVSLKDVVRSYPNGSPGTYDGVPFVRAQANTDMRRLVRCLARESLTIPVVGETDSMTVGAMIGGVGVGSSSHRFGFFSESVLGVEVMLANGTVLRASRNEHVDIFEALPSSHGSGCFLLSADIRTVPAKRYVRCVYRRVGSHAEACEVLEARCTAPAAEIDAPVVDGSGAGFADDFIDAMMFGTTEGVVISGVWSDGEASGEEKLPITRPYSHWWSPFYFNHARAVCAQLGRNAEADNADGFDMCDTYEELVPLEDYVFRYDRGMFWTMPLARPLLNAAWVRVLFGWITTSRLFHHIPRDDAKHGGHGAGESIVQDIVVPVAKAPAALEEVGAKLDVFPLWVCPCINVQSSGKARPAALWKPGPQKLFLDVGVYGVPTSRSYDAVASHGALQAIASALGGFLLHPSASPFVREANFFSWPHDRAAYERFRSLTGAEGAFAGIYEGAGGGTRLPAAED